MSKYLKIYRDFSGGLSEAANDNIKDNELLEAKNIMPGDGYGIAKAPGVVTAYPPIPVEQPTLNRISRLLEFKPLQGDTRLIAFVTVPTLYEDIYSFDTALGTWQKIAEQEIAALDAFTFGGKLYWLNGQKLRVYDGETITDAALTPADGTATEAETAVWKKINKAIAVEQRGQRWFFATADNEVIFTAVGDPTAVEIYGIININTKNGDGITALHEFNEGLLIFKKYSVHYLVGWDFQGGSDVQLIQLNVSSGTIFPQTVRTVDNGVLYLGTNGIYRLHIPSHSSVVAAKNISEGRISHRLFGAGEILEATAAVWDNTYHISLRYHLPAHGEQEAAIADREYRYLVHADSFFGEFTMPTYSYAVGLNGINALFIGSANGYILRYTADSFQYFDPIKEEYIPIPCRAATKCYDVAGSMAQEVRIDRLELAIKQYLEESCDLALEVKADYEERAWSISTGWSISGDESLVYSEGLLGNGIWGWQDTVTKEMVLKRRCKRLQFIISAEGENQPLLVYGVAALYRKKRVKGSRRGVEITQ